MTQADFNSKYGRLAMPCPFGDNDSANITSIAATPLASDFNFETGFKSSYSAPKSSNGKFVTRKEINAIGNLASRNDFYSMCGGLNTFDAAIATSIGGYPKGAVLEYIVGYKLYKVISLVDANKVDFIANGIDGVNWQYLNSNIPEINDEPIEIGNIANSVSSAMEAIPLSVLLAKKSGVVFISETTELTGANSKSIKYYSTDVSAGGTYSTKEFYGNALAYKILTQDQLSSITYPSPSNMNGWKIMPSQGFISGAIADVKFTNNYSSSSLNVSTAIQTITQYSTSIPFISSGQYIAFCYLCGIGQGTTVAADGRWGNSDLTQITATYSSFCLLFKYKISIS